MDCYIYNSTGVVIGRSLLSYSWTYSGFLNDQPRLFVAARLRLAARSNTIGMLLYSLCTRLFPRFPCGTTYRSFFADVLQPLSHIGVK